MTCDQIIKYTDEGSVTLIDTTVSIIYALNPCAKVASASLDVRNTDPTIDFPYTITAGEDKQIAVPDLAWTIPEVGTGKGRCRDAAHAAVTAIAATTAADPPPPRPLFPQLASTRTSASLVAPATWP